MNKSGVELDPHLKELEDISGPQELYDWVINRASKVGQDQSYELDKVTVQEDHDSTAEVINGSEIIVSGEAYSENSNNEVDYIAMALATESAAREIEYRGDFKLAEW